MKHYTTPPDTTALKIIAYSESRPFKTPQNVINPEQALSRFRMFFAEDCFQTKYLCFDGGLQNKLTMIRLGLQNKLILFWWGLLRKLILFCWGLQNKLIWFWWGLHFFF